VLLEFHSGVMAGRPPVPVEPGKVLEVGRTEFSDVICPHDPQMSGRHFALECLGDRCIIRDLRSSNGTFVNNHRVESATLRDGDEILAGQTVFTIRVEQDAPVAPNLTPTATGIDTGEKPTLHSLLMQQSDAEPAKPGEATPAGEAAAPPRAEVAPAPEPTPRPRVVAPADPPTARPPALEKPAEVAPAPTAGPPAIVKPVLKEPFEWPINVRNFRPDPGNYTFAVIDAAAVPELIEHARQLGMDLRCLFPDAPEPLARVAPYVVAIPSKSNFFHHWADSLGRNPGILMESPERLESVFDHCRKVFLSRDEAGQSRFFRFYDPRVLRPYLPTCTLDELTRFFGTTHAILVEDETAAKLLRFTPSNAGLRLQVLKVEAASHPLMPTEMAY
jgi:hypothetical protein